MHLKTSVSPARRLGGKLAAVLLLAGTCLASLSAQADSPATKSYKIHFKMEHAAPRILLKAGETGTVTSGTGADAWSTRIGALPAGDEVRLEIQVRHGDKEPESFTLVMPEGGHGKFAVSDGPGKEFEVALQVTEQK